jgi:amino acid permease
MLSIGPHMADEKKLSIALQLVGLTAVLVFCFFALGVFNLARALWLSHETISSLEPSSQVELFLPLLIFGIVCIASLFTFLALLFRNARNAALIGVAYLALLLLFLAIQLVSGFLARSLRPELQPMFAVWVGIRLLYAAWIVGLLVKIWSEYWRKPNLADRSH